MTFARRRRRIEIYPIFSYWELVENPSARQRWRWRLLAANNRVMADGANSYPSVAKARRAIKQIRTTFHMAGVIVFDSKGKVTYEA
jgi:uncharacterized protein YegP (UPF0339 family)